MISCIKSKNGERRYTVLAKYKNKEQLAQWLSEAIMIEMKKPINEIDVEFVDSCEALLNTLMGEPQVADSEVQEQIDKIMKKQGSNVHKPKFFRRSKNLIAASIAVIFLFCSSVAFCAFNPTILDMLLTAIKAGVGQPVEEQGVTYEYLGKTIIYDTVEDLVESENLDIKYPSEFPYNAKVVEVLRPEEDNITVFCFDDLRVSFHIEHNTLATYNMLDYDEVVAKNEYVFYLCYKDSYVAAFLFSQNDLYTLTSDTKEDLMIMINSFDFER